MSTRFGTYVGHSAKSNVLETQLESSNIAHLYIYLENTSRQKNIRYDPIFIQYVYCAVCTYDTSNEEK